MLALSLEKRLLKEFEDHKEGKIYQSKDFVNMGSDDAIRKALQRLEKQGTLIRISRGLYLHPQRDPILGPLLPSVAEIAETIARKEKLRIIANGEQALLQMGFSTQVPMEAVYLSDGGPRNFKIDNRTLVFKSTAPKNLSSKGTITGPLIQALKTLGKDMITPEISDQIHSLLARENPVLAEHDANLSPAWIRKIILDAVLTKNAG